jgi:hypothetical protein
LEVTNALAYSTKSSIIAEKGFITLTTGGGRKSQISDRIRRGSDGSCSDEPIRRQTGSEEIRHRIERRKPVQKFQDFRRIENSVKVQSPKNFFFYFVTDEPAK